LLPLEIFAKSSEKIAIAIVEGETGVRRVLLCNRLAACQGVRAGLPVNAALALSPSLTLLRRDLHREQETIKRLAAWAGQFTSMVSLEPPRSLLLEIRASLKLFGGIDSLLSEVTARLRSAGFTARRAVAPFPTAAVWFARTEDGVVIPGIDRLVGRIGRLPLACTRWPRNVLDALNGMGVAHLGDVLRLPRDGFARRLGPVRLAELDRATGKMPEPRKGFQIPEVYMGKVDMPEETFDQKLMVYEMERLLVEMEGFLRACQRGVQQPLFSFHHPGTEITRLVLGLSRVIVNAGDIGNLLIERMVRLDLPAPVIALSLESGETLPMEVVKQTFSNDFNYTETVKETTRALIDRLRARLGKDAVRGVCILAEHRPESAWAYTEPGTSTGVKHDGGRPFWILEKPRPLEFHDGRPWFEGRLVVESGPERIETGWWDGCDVSRDYFVVRSPGGMQLWVYRERRMPGNWFLHGVFG